MAALVVTAAVAIACWADLADPWWAGVSGFISLQATSPASLRRSVLRVLGTAAGAALALILLPMLAYDHLAFSLVLWGMATLAILGFMVSPHGYAWLFFAITFIFVCLMSVDDPPAVLDHAFNRTAEVTVGSMVAVLVSWTLAPDRPDPDPAGPAAAPPGWSDLLGANLPAVLYALRGGFAVMLVPLLWRWLEWPNVIQMPITVAAVMAVPLASADPASRTTTLISRGMQRLFGCLLGGLAGLLCLALSMTSLLPWLGLLASGVWVGSQIQSSRRGVGYVGTQGAVAFILTLVQGAGPPTSILPGIDRFVGVTLGLAVLLGAIVLLDLLFLPSPHQALGPARPPGP